MEKDVLKENINIFATEMRAVRIHELKNTSKKYQQLLNERIELKKQLDSIMLDEHKELFEKYLAAFFAISSLESDYLYLCGYADCIKVGEMFK